MLPELWLLKCRTFLFLVLSGGDSKNLVTAWAKHLSAAERSSWLNMKTRQWNPFFFIYYLNSICWYISFLHFKIFKIQFHEVPPLLYVLVCKIHSSTCQRRQFQACYGNTNKKFMLCLADSDQWRNGGCGRGRLREPFNKRNIYEKILFQIVLNEVLRSCEKLLLLMWKLWCKTIRTKKLDDCIIKKIMKSSFKTWNIM